MTVSGRPQRLPPPGTPAQVTQSTHERAGQVPVSASGACTSHGNPSAPDPSIEPRCQVLLRYPKFGRRISGRPYEGQSVPCNRLLTDPCRVCKAFDERKDEWAAVYNELANKPRVAVEGDI